jgi:hypothetical protein
VAFLNCPVCLPPVIRLRPFRNRQCDKASGESDWTRENSRDHWRVPPHHCKLGDNPKDFSRREGHEARLDCPEPLYWFCGDGSVQKCGSTTSPC